MKMLVFPSRTRGLPIGVRFIRELLAMTPKDTLNEYEDQQANCGAPVAMIALACTLVGYVLLFSFLRH